MARVLVVGGGERAGELAGSGHLIDGDEGVDPARLVTLTPRLEGVSVVCWLFGDSGAEALHGDTLGALLEYLVDTPVRGLVYERSEAHPGGERIVEQARETFRMRCAVISPGEDLAGAVQAVLAG
jgi:hypothetical protein